MLEATVATALGSWLARAGAKFVREAYTNGLRPDFILKPPSGESIIIEIKGWDPENIDVDRAVKQAEDLESLSGVDEAYIFIPGLSEHQEQANVVGLAGLKNALQSIYGKDIKLHSQEFEAILSQDLDRGKEQELLTHLEEDSGLPRDRTPETEIPKVFASMPFDHSFDDVWFVGVRGACETLDMEADRVDKDPSDGFVRSQITGKIEEASVVVADVSTANPNVMHEIGYAEALGTPVIQISQPPLSDLPFNIQGRETVRYEIGRTYKLRDDLEPRLKRYRG